MKPAINRVTQTLRKVLGCVFAICAVSFSGPALIGCASRILQFENSEKVLENKEFDTAIKVKEIAEPTPAPSESPAVSPGVGASPAPMATPKPKPTPKSKKQKAGAKAAPTPSGPQPREPRHEDDEGFVGRRPLVDPFKVGEEVVLDISYFGVDAGELVIQVMPFVEVNGRKAYRFRSLAKTVSVFEMIYKVADVAETFVDYETLQPFSYTLNVKETKQLRDARALHDWEKGRVFFWDKKITKDHGVEEKKMDWELPPYAQNIFSALWYLRTFKFTVGKKLRFQMSHENENLMITVDVVRKEKIKTDAGTFDTIVIHPSAEKNGEKKNIGENYFWLTDDDRKLMVRMESKIKIGTIVGSLNRIK